MRRHGSRFAGEVVNHSKKPRLREFIFSNADKIMLVFEDLLLRFYKGTAPITSASNSISGISQANPAVLTYVGADNFANGDRVLVTGTLGMTQVNNREFTVANVNVGANTFELSGINSTAYDAYTSGGTVSKIYTLTTTYLEADLPTLYFAQSADVVYITHPSYTPRQLSRVSDTNWTIADIAQTKGPFATLNTDDTIRVLCTGLAGGSHQPGDAVTVKSNSAIFTANHVGTYFRMQELYLADNAVGQWQAASGFTIAVGVQVAYGSNVYALSDVGVGAAMGSVAPVHTVGDAWDAPIGSGNVKKWLYLHSRWAIVKLTGFTDSKNMTGTITTYLCDGLAPNSENVTATSNAGSGGTVRITTGTAHGLNVGDYVSVAAVGGTTEANGDWKVSNVPSTTTFDIPVVWVNAWTAGGTVKRYATWLWHFGAFSTARGFPNCVALHEQRLVYANTSSQPTGVWASRSGDYNNFYPGVLASDSISYNIAANQADPIRWIASGQDLCLGTLNQEFAGYGGGIGDPITPTNARIIPQSAEGAVNVQPIKVGSNVIYVNRDARRLMSYGLEPSTQSISPYGSVDLLQLAEHLATTAKKITRMAWAKNPCRALWVLRSDGTLICGTQQVDQQIPAWTKCPVTGTIEDIAVMPSSDGTTDDLWMVVNRTINGSTRRYIEYLAPPFEPTSTTDKTTMGFLDCALQYSGASASVLTGLFHLEGQTVKVVGGGALQTDKTVSNGKITIDSAITQGWVGLAYTSRLRTLRPEGAGQVTAQGKTKRTPRITVRVLNALGGTAGPGDESKMDELIRRDLSDPMDASSPLKSDDVDLLIASDFDLAGRIAIVQSDPLPLDITALMNLQSVTES